MNANLRLLVALCLLAGVACGGSNDVQPPVSDVDASATDTSQPPPTDSGAPTDGAALDAGADVPIAFTDAQPDAAVVSDAPISPDASGNDGTTCAKAIPVALALGKSVTLTGTTAKAGAETDVSSFNPGCNGLRGLGPERVYAITPSARGFLTARLTTSSNELFVYAERACGSTNPATCGRRVVSIPVEPLVTEYIVVEGDTATTEDSFTLDVALNAGTCADPIAVPLAEGVHMLRGNTAYQSNGLAPSCGGLLGLDVVYAMTPEKTARAQLTLLNADTSFDAVLATRSTCASATSELACHRNGTTGANEDNFVDVTSGTPIYVIVDGNTAAAKGPYVMRTRL